MDKKLFLIDGHALIFKMYYAFLRHPMINSKGADMSVLFGFTKYILELIEKERPTHLAVAFDPPGGTFRHEMYPEYKGTRSETPQLIIDSLEPLCELCKAMGFPVLMVKGFEADDVIGSMAKRAEKEGFTVYMVTPDKDYGQLISEKILQFKPGKSGSDNEVIDVRKVCEKYNINSPEQVIEILTICGDSSDNVPGVKGVGEVGAGKLISKFGTVKEIYRHLDELTPKQREAFVSSEGHIMLSHELVTIKTDIVLDVDSKAMELTGTYSPEAADLFEKYEFGSLRRFLGNIQPSGSKETKQVEFTEGVPAQVIKEAQKLGRCAIITECRSEGIFSEIARVTIAAGALTAEGMAADFRQIISDPQIIKYGYDLKFQRNLLAHAGMSLEGTLMDIELMHYLINPEKSHKVEILAKTYLEINLEENENAAEVVEALSLFDEIPEDDTKPGKAKEAAVTFLLGEAVWKDMETNGVQTLYLDMEEPLLKVLSDMEMEGVKIDLVQLRKYSAELNTEMNQIQDRIREMAQESSLNIMSPKQIGILLFEKLRLDPKKKPKSGSNAYPTDEETLSALADKHPIINEILEFRGVKKLLSTYIEPFPSYISPITGKVHTTFNHRYRKTELIKA